MRYLQYFLVRKYQPISAWVQVILSLTRQYFVVASHYLYHLNAATFISETYLIYFPIEHLRRHFLLLRRTLHFEQRLESHQLVNLLIMLYLRNLERQQSGEKSSEILD